MATTIKQTNQYISELMDDHNLTQEALDKLLSDEEAIQKWHEYHTIRDCMNHGKETLAYHVNFIRDMDFQAELLKISAEHQAASMPTATIQNTLPAANQSFKFFAVAASLAAISVSVWQFIPSGGMAQTSNTIASTKATVSENNALVNVNEESQVASASQTVVMLNTVKSQQPENQSAVRVEKQNSVQKQTIVQ